MIGRWMSTPTGKVTHLVGMDGEVACGCPLKDAAEGTGLLRCRRCTIVAAGATQAADVVAATGATYRQIDYWERRGYIHAEARVKGAGSGTWRVWPAEELRVATEMARLVYAGLSPEAAHKAARNGGLIAPGIRVVVELAELGQVAA